MKTRIACAQIDIEIGNSQANRQKITERTRYAAEQGAKLVVFPECAITGYCFESLNDAARLAEPLDGPSAEIIADECRKAGVYVISGFIERDGSDYYNAAMLVGPDGVVGGYRKVHLPFLGVDRFLTPGNRPFEVFKLPFGRVGINICYDTSFPEAPRSLKLLGAELIVLPTNWPRDAWRTPGFVINTRSNENHVNFVAVNRVGTERGWKFIGKSIAVDFNGDTIAKADSDNEEMLLVDIDMEGANHNRIVNAPGSYEIDRIGDRRPEFYDLIVAPASKKIGSAT